MKWDDIELLNVIEIVEVAKRYKYFFSFIQQLFSVYAFQTVELTIYAVFIIIYIFIHVSIFFSRNFLNFSHELNLNLFLQVDGIL